MNRCINCNKECYDKYCSFICQYPPLGRRKKIKPKPEKSHEPVKTDGVRRCKQCSGLLGPDDFKYCSDECRRKVNEKVATL